MFSRSRWTAWQYRLADPARGAVWGRRSLHVPAARFWKACWKIILYFALRGVRHAGWILVDGIVTLSGHLDLEAVALQFYLANRDAGRH